MARTVFWSWQSDRDGRVTRHLIRDALVKALDRIAASTELEERLEIDQDTKGKAGLADIVGSILEKIDHADVFVADITPIAVSDGGKQVANPNVLIELGYAKKALSPARCVTIWNTAFTNPRPEDLPFDLRGRRAPITYSLPEGSSKTDLAAAREQVAQEFVVWIAGCLDEVPRTSPSSRPWLPHNADNPGIWFVPRIPFAANLYRIGGGNILIAGDVKSYARMLPASFDPTQHDNGVMGPFIGAWSSWTSAQVEAGSLTLPSTGTGAEDPVKVSNCTLWVRDTGEVWSVESGMISDWEARLTFNAEWVVATWTEFLDRAPRHSIGNGGSAPFTIRLGATGLTGLSRSVNSHFATHRIATRDGFEREFTLTTLAKAEWVPCLLDAWTQLNRCFNMPPPPEADLNEMLRLHGQS